MLISVVLVGCSTESPVRSGVRNHFDANYNLSELFVESDGSLNCLVYDLTNATSLVLQYDRHLNLKQVADLNEEIGGDGTINAYQLKSGNWILTKNVADYNQSGVLQLYLTGPDFSVIHSKILWSIPAKAETLYSNSVLQIEELDNGEVALLLDTNTITQKNGQPVSAARGDILYRLTSGLDQVFAFKNGTYWGVPKIIEDENNSLFMIGKRVNAQNKELFNVSKFDAEGNRVELYNIGNGESDANFIYGISLFNRKILLSRTFLLLDDVQYCLIDPDARTVSSTYASNYSNRMFNRLPRNILPGQGHVVFNKGRGELNLLTIDEDLDLREKFTIPLPQDTDYASRIMFRSCYTEDGSLIIAVCYSRKGLYAFTLYKFDEDGNLVSGED